MFRGLLAVFLFVAPALVQAQETEPYFVAFLRPDPARKALEKTEGDRMQDAHMTNIRAMAADGILVSAGPFGDTPTTFSGIFVLKAPSLEDARRVAAKDPTVVAHRNAPEVHAWQGPAGIGKEYVRLHAANPGMPEGMAERALVLLFGDAGKAQYPAGLMERLRREGKLSAAGPMDTRSVMASAGGTGEALLGMAVFRPGMFDEARRFLEDSAEVRSGVLRVEMHRWWCSAHVLPWEQEK